LYFCI